MCDNKCLKCIHSAVLPILVTAEHYDGYAYGEYVRQVIPKVMLNDFIPCNIKIIRLWFSDEKKKDTFLSVVKGIKRYSGGTMSIVDFAGDIVLPLIITTGQFSSTLFFRPDKVRYHPGTNSLQPTSKISLSTIMNEIRTKTTTVLESSVDGILTTSETEPRDMLDDGWTIIDHLGRILTVTEAGTLAFLLPKVDDVTPSEDEQTVTEGGITQAA